MKKLIIFLLSLMTSVAYAQPQPPVLSDLRVLLELPLSPLRHEMGEEPPAKGQSKAFTSWKNGIITLNNRFTNPAAKVQWKPGHHFRNLWEHNYPADELKKQFSETIELLADWNDYLWNRQETYEPQDTDVPPLENNQDNGAPQNIVIFVDYSNISAGLEIPGGNHPINPHGLAQFLENNRVCVDKQIAGSFPHAGHDVWKVWNHLGYKTRIASSGKELFVDDSLHAQIFRVLLQKGDKKPTIVLVTGDGNSNNNYSSFVECVLRAVEAGVKVEIVSWKQRLNKVYLELASKYTKLITIRYLDQAKNKILQLY